MPTVVRSLQWICASAVAAFSVPHAFAQDEGALSSLLDPYRGERPGGAAVVIEDGEVIFAEAVGLADLERGAAFTLDTPVQTGSVAKMFTAYAVVLLEQEGALSFDDEVRGIIGELPDYGHPLTIRHLLNHQSGLSDQWGAFWMAGYGPSDLAEHEVMLRYITRQEELDFAPGTEYNYVNSNYTLLAEIVQRVSGMSFPAFLEERVFRPLGMTNTRAVSDASALIPGRAESYVADGEGNFSRALFEAETFGPHNIVSTARDLGRFAALLENPKGKLGLPVRQMRRMGRLANGEETFYGMGLIELEWLGARHFHHFGVDAGYRAYVGAYPSVDAAVVLVGNASDFNSPALSQEIGAAAFPEELARAEEEEREAAPLSADVIEALSGTWAVTEGPGLRANNHRYEGPFAVRGGPAVEIMPSGERLAIASRWAAPMVFGETRGGDLVIPTRMGDITLRDPDRFGSEPDRITLEQFGETVLERVVEEPAEDPARFAGRYYSHELQTFYEIEAGEGGGLVLSHLRNGSADLEPAPGEGRFSGPWIFGAVQFEKAAEGGMEMFISYGRARRIPFQRTE
jgi:CubicO group peptidase (beta-lactamase class C family)